MVGRARTSGRHLHTKYISSPAKQTTWAGRPKKVIRGLVGLGGMVGRFGAHFTFLGEANNVALLTVNSPNGAESSTKVVLV